MSSTQDTEITLGTGKMLALFFGLVVMCAAFFGMGYSLGRNSVRPLGEELPQAGTPVNPGVRPSGVKPVNNAPASDLTFYKSVGQKDADPQLSSRDSASSPAASAPAADSKPAPPDPMAAPVLNGYYVQVAAVSKQEDAEALVDALKKKQYPAFANNLPDKLFHVQVGPYADIKEAEGMRARLVNDGYNPILKK